MMRTLLPALLFLAMLTAAGGAPAMSGSAGTSEETVYLSGRGPADAVEWDFKFTMERAKAGEWTRIPVPFNWERHGFGTYSYREVRTQETGLYRHLFKVPEAWRNRSVRIVFEASMTDTEVKINGQLAGPIHQGMLYQFHYDITKLLKFGADNLLEVKVEDLWVPHGIC